MSWLRIEGRMPNNRKVSALSDAAFRLYVTASCWCVEEETDGLIPPHIPETLPKAPRGKALDRAVTELLSAGVWETADDGQYVVHDHLAYNPSAAQSKAVREAKAAAGAAGGRAKANGLHGKRLAAVSHASKQTPSSDVAESKQTSSPRAGAGARSDSDSDSDSDPESQTTTSDLGDQSDPGRETLCPNDLDQRAEKLGVLAKLAENLAVPIESVRHEAKDFREFYTFGGGAGECRTGWMRQLRERIRKRHREGQLKPVSAIEHASRGGNGAATDDDAGLILRARRGEYGPGIQGMAERNERADVIRAAVRSRAEKLKLKPADREGPAPLGQVVSDLIRKAAP